MVVLILATFVDLFATIFNGLIIMRIIVGIFAKPKNRFYRGLINITEPVLAPVRRALPKTGAYDFSPTVTVLGLYLLDLLVSGLLAGS